jgi:hypothetical protein
MASLQNQQIDQTYAGLIKTNDEAAVGATLKALEDGAGNTLPVQVSTSTVNFTGTVTGDNNTTYDLASAQNAANVDVTLTGSDATADTVTLAAGTNITLTDNGSNQITIDAAGGGGAAIDQFDSQTGAIVRGNGDTRYAWRQNVAPVGLVSQGAYAGDFILFPVYIEEGTVIDEMRIQIENTSTTTSGEIRLAIYNSNTDSNGNIYADALETSGSITWSTTITSGIKTVTGLNHTLGASAKNIYWVGTHIPAYSGGTLAWRAPSANEYIGMTNYRGQSSISLEGRPLCWYAYYGSGALPANLPTASSLVTNYRNYVQFK